MRETYDPDSCDRSGCEEPSDPENEITATIAGTIGDDEIPADARTITSTLCDGCYEDAMTPPPRAASVGYGDMMDRFAGDAEEVIRAALDLVVNAEHLYEPDGTVEVRVDPGRFERLGEALAFDSIQEVREGE